MNYSEEKQPAVAVAVAFRTKLTLITIMKRVITEALLTGALHTALGNQEVI